MNWQALKLEFFHIRKAFFSYHQGWDYVRAKWFLAPKILDLPKILERPINSKDLSVHLLTCHRDLLMSIWSLASWYQSATIFGQLIIHNDGTLTKDDKQLLLSFFPSAKIVETSNFLKEHDDIVTRYPALYEFRSQYKNFSFKKLVDPYFTSSTPMNLIIDSDLFWFKAPKEIEDQILAGGAVSLMQANNSPTDVTFKNDFAVDRRLTMANAGIIFYAKSNFNFEKLNMFLGSLDTTDPKSLHFADQLGYAICLDNLELLSPEVYPIKGKVTSRVSIKHYTGPRRVLFYLEAITTIAKNIL
ncbi:MAG: hypothetical protein HUU49_00630 [Candidatus Buchananbacteria bacterium]|nr:hypothetical protein [Candidatus Buchananbacteria bacterium]